jgi:hypothetical protein
LYYDAQMISKLAYFRENANKLEAEESGKYRFFDTPEEREELIKISEAYPAYLEIKSSI